MCWGRGRGYLQQFCGDSVAGAHGGRGVGGLLSDHAARQGADREAGATDRPSLAHYGLRRASVSPVISLLLVYSLQNIYMFFFLKIHD